MALNSDEIIVSGNNNVMLVEPNLVNTNNDMTNSIPQYQDMYIFAELTAKSKGRTVIINGNATSNDSEKVNFIGNNQNEDDPNYLNFTTNYYDGSVPESKTHYEGFGIGNIKIVINSSFIPQVDIQFIDTRGLAFFNQKDSPYRMLFDFPPPIFTLTVKGYYGKAITYQLHLVKYTSEFKAENGNFIIDAQFVAVTFAPLTDILFRYVINTPLIENSEDSIPDTGTKPKNTNDLILKFKNLYKAIADKLETDAQNIEYKSVLNAIDSANDVFDIVDGTLTNSAMRDAGKVYLVIKSPETEVTADGEEATRASENYNLNVIDGVNKYDDLIKEGQTSGTKLYEENRLIVLYEAGTNIPLTSSDYVNPFQEHSTINDDLTESDGYKYPSRNYDSLDNALLAFKETLVSKNITEFEIEDGDLSTPKSFTNGKQISTSKQILTDYYGLDITEYYNKVYKSKQSLEETRSELAVELATKVNNMVTTELGMKPSIYNVFEVILNDVDKFFSILRKTSEDADSAHNTPKAKRIITSDPNNIDSPSSSGNVPDHIYPFPLIVQTTKMVGGNKQERIAPIVLSERTWFPELDLVTDFIDTFLLQRNLDNLYLARNNQNEDGIYDWIPISPLDSTLAEISPKSPYLNINDDVRGETLKILLKRYYMLSQAVLPYSWYGENDVLYGSLFAQAEATNLLTGILNVQNSKTLELMAKDYQRDMDIFYTDIAKLTDTYLNTDGTTGTTKLASFPVGLIEYFSVTPETPENNRLFTDKNNAEFVGFEMTDEPVDLQVTGDGASKQGSIASFKSTVKRERLNGENGLFKNFPLKKYFQFSNENIIYFTDSGLGDNVTKQIERNSSFKINGIPTFTRYLYDSRVPEYRYWNSGWKHNFHFPGVSKNGKQHDPIAGMKECYELGNEAFSPTYEIPKIDIESGSNLLNDYIGGLQYPSTMDIITGQTSDEIELAYMLLLSNFGETMSPFNVYPNALNRNVFSVPAGIEVPAFYAPYIGMLLLAIDDGDWENRILNYFTGETGTTGVSGKGRHLPCQGFFVLSDLRDVRTHLSEKDKTSFKLAFVGYKGSLDRIRGRIISLNKNLIQNNSFSTNSLINYYLNPSSKEIPNISGRGMYSDIITDLCERVTLLNFSQITFDMGEVYASHYNSIEYQHTEGEAAKKNIRIDDRFFKELFGKVAQDINVATEDLKEGEESLRKAKGDEDIITQLYYSFKNINDKWLTGSSNSNKEYPFNKPNKKLIDSFAFVDRAMNPIGDTIINAELLIDLYNDPNVSLFTVLSQLLSLNGFEFFPLQNFMSFDTNDSWVESFEIDTNGVNNNVSSSFVCMYIGGSSSYPSVSDNGFVNDGIIDISKPGVGDYSTEKISEDELKRIQSLPKDALNENQKQLLNTEFPYQDVRAFRVRFGEQDQSMFQDIKIDSKEYPETNESIQILSRLASDGMPDAPVPKGQNLYNLYENRSYKATVTGFGNAMIQPTQYFQLENVPLFNGAYIILSVEHNITPNKMTTSFSGTKLLKFPVPRVMNPIAFTTANFDQQPAEIVAVSNAIIERENVTHYNSMYAKNKNVLKIS